MPKFLGICTKISQRWLTIILAQFVYLSLHSMRSCLSIAITEMTLPHNNTKTFSHDTCPDRNDYNNTLNVMKKHFNRNKYDWNEQIQGTVLASFYGGYIIMNLFVSPVIRKLGCKHTLGLSIFCTSTLTLLTPICTNWGGATALIILRVLVGFVEGVSFPAIIYLLAHWIPEDERTKAGAIVFSAAPLGTIFGLLVSGIILQHSEIGWPMVFYFYGSVGLLSFLLSTAFCYSKPSESPFITDDEANYLRNKLNNANAERLVIPWRQMFKSLPVWALLIQTFGHAWIYVMIVNDMPKYMKNVLNISPQNNGLFSSMPQLSMIIGSFLFSWITEILVAKNTLSITVIRKIGVTISSVIPAIFLITSSYAGCDDILVIALQSTGSGVMGCMLSSVAVNPVDLSPNFSSTLSGFINGITTVLGMLCPYVVGILTPNQTINEWRLVFWIVFGIMLVTAVPFLFCGSAEVQEWNDPNFSIKDTSASKSDAKEDVVLLPDKETTSKVEFEVA